MGKFRRTNTPIEGLFLVETTVFGDSRGFFMETYSLRDFQDLGISTSFVQDNHSRSNRGVLRGLHFQTLHPQGKLIRVIAGRVWDVAVDLRVESSTFGSWYGIELSAENKLQMYVPPRFAHGFLTIEDGSEFLYSCTDYYYPEDEGGILWNDPDIGIQWPLEAFHLTGEQLMMSDKDRKLSLLASLDKKFLFPPK